MTDNIITYCSSCRKDTNQMILFYKRITDSYPSKKKNLPDEIEHHDYIVVECAGCGEVSFVLRWHPTYLDTENDPAIFDEHYPNNNELYDFLSNDEHDELPRQLYNLYDEVRNAFISDSNILAGIGLRTLVEALCIEQKIEGKSLQERIKNLQNIGLISFAELPILDKLRLIGNVSAHQIKEIPIEKLEYALGIINHVIRSVYILPKINKKLKF